MFTNHERPEWAQQRGPGGPHQHRGEPGRPHRGARRRGGPFGKDFADFGPPFGGPFGPGGPRGRGRGRGRGPEEEGPQDGPEGGFPGPWGPGGPRGRRGGGPGGRGFGGPGGRGRGGRGGPGRRSRGDVRLAILALLREEPRHGYQIIQEIAERSGGSWKPSPGSVYPTVSQLADEGLVHTEKESGRTVVHLTEAGTKYTEEHAAELDAVWSQVEAAADDGFTDLRTAGRGLAGAVAQVAQVGSAEQVTQATGILDEARRRLYLLLAEVDATGATGTGVTDGPDGSDDDGSEDPVDETT
ncbi:PadR family transcriptional regulator [Actinomycetospora sp. TBRC 11914]|uniref:PadR family transcriptional regulator n=1 Tax=Actinomycetospora sp. TBRC 11914 TaxID=2729387 RepID=UPI00145DF0FC|nr:PadR family transcriptional regulator [Actinomycetospora sp. TBRC 11914]NMO89852.1 PadR family transcriptional regulator [Actinomycetospora sp. TBRC 11914]